MAKEPAMTDENGGPEDIFKDVRGQYASLTEALDAYVEQLSGVYEGVEVVRDDVRARGGEEESGGWFEVEYDEDGERVHYAMLCLAGGEDDDPKMFPFNFS